MEAWAVGDYVSELYMVRIHARGDEQTIKGSIFRICRKAYANGLALNTEK